MRRGRLVFRGLDIHPPHPEAVADQELDQVMTDEAAGAGDEYALGHGLPPHAGLEVHDRWRGPSPRRRRRGGGWKERATSASIEFRRRRRVAKPHPARTAERMGAAALRRTEERRGGKACVSTCRSRRWPCHKKKKEQL